MPTVDILPGELNFRTSITNDFSVLLDFDIVLTGYTFSSNIVSEVTETVTAITVTNTNLAAGQITLSLTDAQLATIGSGTHRWYLQWTGSSVDRRVLDGDFVIQ